MNISADNFAFVSQFIQNEAGIVLEKEKTYLVESRLAPLSRQEGFASIDDLCRCVRFNHANGLKQKVVEAMTINETSFFRDVSPFEALRTTIIPELLQRRIATRTLSLWSAGCSTGQEPYSTAMVLLDCVPDLRNWRVSILATDLSTEALAKAKRGCYTQLEVNRGLPIACLIKHFHKNGTQWELNPEVCQIVEFRRINLKESLFSQVSGPFDVVFCRNVMIYFDTAVKSRLLRQIRGLLQPNGYLVLGGAESVLWLDESFTRVQMGKAVYYQPKS